MSSLLSQSLHLHSFKCRLPRACQALYKQAPSTPKPSNLLESQCSRGTPEVTWSSPLPQPSGISQESVVYSQFVGVPEWRHHTPSSSTFPRSWSNLPLAGGSSPGWTWRSLSRAVAKAGGWNHQRFSQTWVPSIQESHHQADLGLTTGTFKVATECAFCQTSEAFFQGEVFQACF